MFYREKVKFCRGKVSFAVEKYVLPWKSKSHARQSRLRIFIFASCKKCLRKHKKRERERLRQARALIAA